MASGRGRCGAGGLSGRHGGRTRDRDEEAGPGERYRDRRADWLGWLRLPTEPARLDRMPWQVYEVRRVIRPRPTTPPAANASRSLRAVTAGRRAQMAAVGTRWRRLKVPASSARTASSRPGCAAAARHSRLSSTSWSPPRRTTGQGRPRLRGSLVGGGIRSRRPARESGRNAEWAQIPDPSPPFHAFPWFRSVTAAKGCDAEADHAAGRGF